jgi:hypothetical protein
MEKPGKSNMKSAAGRVLFALGSPDAKVVGALWADELNQISKNGNVVRALAHMEGNAMFRRKILSVLLAAVMLLQLSPVGIGVAFAAPDIGGGGMRIERQRRYILLR